MTWRWAMPFMLKWRRCRYVRFYGVTHGRYMVGVFRARRKG